MSSNGYPRTITTQTPCNLGGRSSLPPELWDAILGYAVYVHRRSDTTWAYSMDEKMWEETLGVPSQRLPPRSLATRQAIQLVSRDWLRMGRKFLYEEIYIDLMNRTSFALLLNRLNSRDDGSTEVSAVSHGWWVKRMTIKYFGSQDRVPDLLHLLKACANIRILDFDVPCTPPSSAQLSQILESKFLHSLRGMIVGRCSQLPNVPLESLRMKPDDLARQQSAFSHITSLDLDLYLSYFGSSHFDASTCRFPSLRHVCLSGGVDLKRHINSLEPFFRNNGSKLLGLTAWSKGSLHLHKLLEHTPVLRGLVVSQWDVFGFSLNLKTYPSIDHIGINDGKGSGSYSNVHEARALLERIIGPGYFPNLKTVGLHGHLTPTTFDDEWRKLVAEVESQGIHLFNRRGYMMGSGYDRLDDEEE